MKDLRSTLRRLVNVGIFLLMAGALFLGAASPAAANMGPQEWYLSSITSPVNGKIMMRTYGGVSGSLNLSAAGTQFWLSDQAAVIDCKFTEGIWIIQLKTDTYWGDTNSSKCRFSVGEWDVLSSAFVPFSTITAVNLVFENGKQILRAELQMGSQTVHKNNFLTLRIQNQDTVSHVVYTDGESSMKSPDSDPGYPTPEIHPDSVASISALPGKIFPGGKVKLIITDTNTGDVPLTDPTMELISDPASIFMTLGRESTTFWGGDSNDDGIFDPGETWEWRVYIMNVNAPVTFTATGHGNDPYGHDVTAPQYPTEQVEVTVEQGPLVPVSSNLGIGLLAGGLAVSMTFVISRRKLKSKYF
jgi:hypothetical protein